MVKPFIQVMKIYKRIQWKITLTIMILVVIIIISYTMMTNNESLESNTENNDIDDNLSNNKNKRLISPDSENINYNLYISKFRILNCIDYNNNSNNNNNINNPIKIEINYNIHNEIMNYY